MPVAQSLELFNSLVPCAWLSSDYFVILPQNMQMAVVDSWQKLKLDGVLCPAMECPAVSTGLPKQLKGKHKYK